MASKTEIKNRWNRAHYTRTVVETPKALADVFRACVAENGDTMSGVIHDAMTDYIRRHGGSVPADEPDET